MSVVKTRGVGFLANPQRLNVALTRAKKALYICGNFSSLKVSCCIKNPERMLNKFSCLF